MQRACDLFYQVTHDMLSGKESAVRRHSRCGFDLWVGKIPWRRKLNPLQYSYLGNPIDRGAWWATVHGITELDKTELQRMGDRQNQ